MKRSHERVENLDSSPPLPTLHTLLSTKELTKYNIQLNDVDWTPTEVRVNGERTKFPKTKLTLTLACKET